VAPVFQSYFREEEIGSQGRKQKNLRSGPKKTKKIAGPGHPEDDFAGSRRLGPMKRMAFGTVLLLLPLLVGLGAQGGERRWALVVGVDQYQHSDLIPSLKCAVADAKEFARALVEVGGFASGDVYLLTSDAVDPIRQATKGNIAYRLGELPDQVDEDDLVVFYFSGHGMTLQEKGFLLTQDADPRNLDSLEASALSVEWVQAKLKRLRAAKVVVIIDACRSEPVKSQGSRGPEEEGLTEEFSKGFLVKPKTTENDAVGATLFACSLGQKSYEWREQGHGYFTYYLLAGMRGAAADATGRVTLSSLGKYLTEQVPGKVKDDKQQTQVPWPQMEGPGQYRVELGMGEAGNVVVLPTEARLRVTSDPAGATVQVEGETVGKTPCEVIRDLGGQKRQTVEVMVSLKGYRTQGAQVELEVGKTKNWAVGRLERIGPAPGPALQSGQSWTNPVDGSELVLIPGGEFIMGEGWGHEVHVDSFYLGKHEVTNAQWKRFVEANLDWLPGRIKSKYHDGDYLAHWKGGKPLAGEENHPVVYVSWYAAVAYCRWAGLRLPTEAEWEYAAQGGRGYEYGTADGTLSHDLANYDGTGGRDRWDGTAPVGSFPPNPFGIYDLCGNVWEWCSSAYKPYPYVADDGREEMQTDVSRVLRGGSWFYDGRLTRARYRLDCDPRYCNSFFGLRVACGLQAP